VTAPCRELSEPPSNGSGFNNGSKRTTKQDDATAPFTSFAGKHGIGLHKYTRWSAETNDGIYNLKQQDMSWSLKSH
jgi:hypothetical protein